MRKSEVDSGNVTYLLVWFYHHSGGWSSCESCWKCDAFIPNPGHLANIHLANRHLANGLLANICRGTFSQHSKFLIMFLRVFINIVVSVNTKHCMLLYNCNSLYKCNKHKVMSHILKLANMDITYSPQLLYSIVIVYVIEFYSIHCTNVMITNKWLIL